MFNAPPSSTELSSLIPFTNNQYAFGQQVGVLDATVYAYEALGETFASSSYFANKYGPPTTPFPGPFPNTASGDLNFLVTVYQATFGVSGTSGQIQHFVDQINFIEGFLSKAFSGVTLDLAARGAVYGQMLGIEAEINHTNAASSTGMTLVGVAVESPHS